jgi:hypothetical protein
VEKNIQVLGLEGEPKVDEIIRGIAPHLKGIAAALREKAEGTGEGTRQANDQGVPCATRISDFADKCCKVPLSSKDNSGYKDLITAFVRLGLGEMLAAVMRHVDAAYIGISEGMFDVGKTILLKRDKLVHQSKSAQGKSSGGKANKRPDYKCTLRSTLMNMCRAASGWEERASLRASFAPWRTLLRREKIPTCWILGESVRSRERHGQSKGRKKEKKRTQTR